MQKLESDNKPKDEGHYSKIDAFLENLGITPDQADSFGVNTKEELLRLK